MSDDHLFIVSVLIGFICLIFSLTECYHTNVTQDIDHAMLKMIEQKGDQKGKQP